MFFTAGIVQDHFSASYHTKMGSLKVKINLTTYYIPQLIFTIVTVCADCNIFFQNTEVFSGLYKILHPLQNHSKTCIYHLMKTNRKINNSISNTHPLRKTPFRKRPVLHDHHYNMHVPLYLFFISPIQFHS